MKMFKKLMAVALSGVLALSMLTACGTKVSLGSLINAEENVTLSKYAQNIADALEGAGDVDIGALVEGGYIYIDEVEKLGEAWKYLRYQNILANANCLLLTVESGDVWDIAAQVKESVQGFSAYNQKDVTIEEYGISNEYSIKYDDGDVETGYVVILHYAVEADQ